MKQDMNGLVVRAGMLAMPVAFACMMLFAVGCASNPKEGSRQAPAAPLQDGMSKEEILNHEDVKGKPPTVFQQPLDKTREAALRALVFVGCEIKKQSPFHVSGRRPNKMGLFVGSGGETVEVFLYPKSEEETDVWVDTDLSFAGLAGQQDWSKQVLQELTSLLSQ